MPAKLRRTFPNAHNLALAKKCTFYSLSKETPGDNLFIFPFPSVSKATKKESKWFCSTNLDLDVAPVDHSRQRATPPEQVSFSSNSLKRVLLSVSSGIMLDKHMMHSLHCPSVSNRCCPTVRVQKRRSNGTFFGFGKLSWGSGKVQPDFKWRGTSFFQIVLGSVLNQLPYRFTVVSAQTLKRFLQSPFQIMELMVPDVHVTWDHYFPTMCLVGFTNDMCLGFFER